MKFELGHVLSVDIVGYSKLLITDQSELLQKLKEIVWEPSRQITAATARKESQSPLQQNHPGVSDCALTTPKELKRCWS